MSITQETAENRWGRHSKDMERAAMNTALKLVRNEQDAQDIAQEVLIKLWARRESIIDGKAGNFASTVAYNLTLDQLRRPRIFQPLDTVPSLQNRTDASNPQQITETAELSKSLHEAVARIEPPIHRAVMRLFYFEDLSRAEIADRLGIPQANVPITLRRGRAKLRSILEAQV